MHIITTKKKFTITKALLTKILNKAALCLILLGVSVSAYAQNGTYEKRLKKGLMALFPFKSRAIK
jgi:hypothetical protein